MKLPQFTTALVLLLSEYAVQSFPLGGWTPRHLSRTGSENQLFDIAYGNSRFVAVGRTLQTNGLFESSLSLTSTDAVSWAQASSIIDQRQGEEDFPHGIAYGNGQFVAVSSSGRILTSADGTTWSQRQIEAANAYVSLGPITHANGQFFVLGSARDILTDRVNGFLLTSADQTNWLLRQSGAIDFSIRSITYGAGQFVGVGGGWRDILRNPGSHYNTIVTSTDGIVWIQRQAGTSYMLTDVVYAEGQFVAVGSPDTVITSTDGVNWVQRRSGTQSGFGAIAYGNGQFVAAGDSIVSSTDGVTWIEHTFDSQYGSLYGVAFGNGRFVAAGDSGAILESGTVVNLAITRNVGTGALSLSLAGPTGFDYAIQTSSDLISWRGVTTVSNAASTKIILDVLPATSDRQFYRAISQ